MTIIKQRSLLALVWLSLTMNAYAGQSAFRLDAPRNADIGERVMIAIICDQETPALSGFDFSVGFDAGSFSIYSVDAGSAVKDRGWHIFQYSLTNGAYCGGFCPSVNAGITARATGSPGLPAPSGFSFAVGDTLATITAKIPLNCDLNCQFLPVWWNWQTCSDNQLLLLNSDSVWRSDRIFDFEGRSISGGDQTFPTLTGAPDECLVPENGGSTTTLRMVDFVSDGIDLLCADSVNDCRCRGDVNLNGEPNEIGDVIMFLRYFEIGLPAFTIVLPRQIENTDVNCDGQALSVADVVYMLRLMMGDIE